MSDSQMTSSTNTFRIVGVGASAGGLEALEKVVRNISDNSNIALVIVQHLAPNTQSLLAEILQRSSNIPVQQVTHESIIAPNNIYVIPPNHDMKLSGRKLLLQKQSSPRGLRQPIDIFFRSLAEELEDKAIAVILSGTGTDGTLGLRAVKGSGGFVVVQDPDTTQYTGMIQSALSTEMVDSIVEPEDIPDAIQKYLQNLPLIKLDDTINDDEMSTIIMRILQIVQDEIGHDFSNYKPNTIIRRIARRIAITQTAGLLEYLHYLRQKPIETMNLFYDLLIGVTAFFRDKEAFGILRDQLIPTLFEDRDMNDPIRVWVVGCSTGEEAISITILLTDYIETHDLPHSIQIFASDINSRSIEIARACTFPSNIAVDLAPYYLDKYFDRLDDKRYQLITPLRRSIVFSQHSVIKDPPFSNLDLISCRNLLIYFNSELQKSVLNVFHYALKPKAHLFLGTSESVLANEDLFTTVNHTHRIYQRNDSDSKISIPSRIFSKLQLANTQKTTRKLPKAQKLVETALLNTYAPPTVLIDASGKILYYHGKTRHYWNPDQGDASLSIFNLAREELRTPLKVGLRRVITEQREVVFDRIELMNDDDTQYVMMRIQPLDKQDNDRFIIIFEQVQEVFSSQSVPSNIPAEYRKIIEDLETQLQQKEDYLASTLEELQTSNEELSSISEEYQSANEELRSMNEELETSREELQAINEELLTVNAELNNKIEELDTAYANQSALLSNVDVGILFLDDEKTIQLFNSLAGELLNLVTSDRGRSITHFSSNLQGEAFNNILDTVIATGEPQSVRMQTADNIWFLIKVLPFPFDDANNDIGIIVSFTDIDEQIRAQELVEEQSQIYSAMINQLPGAAVALYDQDLRYLIIEGTSILEALGLVVNDSIDHTIDEVLTKQGTDELNQRKTAKLAALQGESNSLYVVKTFRTQEVLG